MSDAGATDHLARIETLQAELEQAQRELAALEARAPGPGVTCNTPAHAAAPAWIAELSATLAKLPPAGGLIGFLGRLGKRREIRLRLEIGRLTKEVRELRRAVGARRMPIVERDERDERDRAYLSTIHRYADAELAESLSAIRRSDGAEADERRGDLVRRQSSLLATLKQLRADRVRLLAEIETLRSELS